MLFLSFLESKINAALRKENGKRRAIGTQNTPTKID